MKSYITSHHSIQNPGMGRKKGRLRKVAQKLCILSATPRKRKHVGVAWREGLLKGLIITKGSESFKEED